MSTPTITAPNPPPNPSPVPAPPRPVQHRRRWPLLVIGASAGTAVWAGWVGLGELVGFGEVHPLPGIWDQATLNTAITLPIGVEAYAVYALSVATTTAPITRAARRFAWISSVAALALGMVGQVAFHLMAADGLTAAPWPIVAAVSCLPVLVLGVASVLWHLAGQHPDPTHRRELDLAAEVTSDGPAVPDRSEPAAPRSPSSSPTTAGRPRRPRTGGRTSATTARITRVRTRHPDWSAAQIAARTGVSERTVRRHLRAPTSSTTDIHPVTVRAETNKKENAA